jgi:hypothetical protein
VGVGSFLHVGSETSEISGTHLKALIFLLLYSVFRQTWKQMQTELKLT